MKIDCTIQNNIGKIGSLIGRSGFLERELRQWREIYAETGSIPAAWSVGHIAGLIMRARMEAADLWASIWESLP